MASSPDRAPLSTPTAVDPGPLLEALDDAAAVLDAEGSVRVRNQRFDQLLASAAAPLPLVRVDGERAALATSREGLVEQARRCLAGIQEVLSQGRARFELIITGERPGAGRWSVTAVATAVDGGPGALVVARDLTPSRLEAHLMRCGDVVEAMQLGLHVYEVEDPVDERSLRLIQANPASELITGIQAAHLVGRTIDENFPEARPWNASRLLADVVRTQRPGEIEMTVDDRSADRKLTFCIKAFPLSGQCVGAIFENVTKRRAMERSLEMTTRFLDSIIDNIPSVIFIKDAENFRYLRVNAEMERALGIRKDEIVGRTDHDMFQQEIADRYIASDREVLATGQISRLPEDLMRIDGTGDRIFLTRKVPIYDSAGRPLYVLGFSEDVTDRRVIEETRRKELILLERQARLLELIRELSTPLLPVHRGVLVAPIVGQVDTARGAHFMEALLAGIERHNAETVIIDVTGVPVIDAGVAVQLLQATRAAALLGTSCALVGVSPEVARSLVELGVDLGGLRTHRDLQAGVLDALSRRERGGGRPIRTGVGG